MHSSRAGSWENGPLIKPPAEIVGDGCGLGPEFAGKSLDCPDRHTAFGRGPFRGFRNIVLFSKDVISNLVHADRMGLYIFLVVGAFGQPHVDDGQLQCCVSIGQHGYPLVCMNCGAVITVRADVYLLDFGFGEKIAEPACQLTGESPWGCFRVTAPEKHHIGMIDGVLDDIGRRIRNALGTLTPHMLCTPVPAFPGVRVSYLQGETAKIFEQNARLAVRGVDGFTLAVAVTLHEDRVVAVFFMDPLDFA